MLKVHNIQYVDSLEIPYVMVNKDMAKHSLIPLQLLVTALVFSGLVVYYISKFI